MDKKLILFEIDNAEIIDNEDPSSQFATAKILAFSSGKNRHDYHCSVETLKKTAQTLNYRPILYTYDKRFEDFGTHTDPEKTLISGFVFPNSFEFVELDDGRIGLYVLAKIWKMYAPNFVKLFEDKNHKNVSVEMELFESAEREDGLSEMVDFAYSGICVLGDFYTPASPSANIEFVTFAKEKNQEFKKAYLLEFGKYEGLDFKIPKKVKENAKQGLELRKKYGRGGTSVGVSTAKYLISNDTASPEKVRHVAKYFPRHAGDNLDDKTSNGWIAWLLWGSNAGRSWSTNLVKQMNQIEEKNMSFFAQEEEEMPYKSIDEVNPAIKGINPTPSLSQSNQIAKQADAIGVSDEKNGWAIAISNFKKTHTIKDGKWVKKEDKFEMTDEEKMALNETNEKKEDETKPENMSADEENPSVESEKPENESEPENDDDEKEEGEDEKENMSLDAYADVTAMLAMLEAETEEAKTLSASFSDTKTVDWSVMAKALFARMCKMAEDAVEKEKAYMSENEDLKKFKYETEKEKFDFAVAQVIAKVEKDLPKERLDEVKESVKDFSFQTFEDFKNRTLALAFEYKKESNDEIKPYPFPQSGSEKHVSSPWK